jgi:hypothetical protein
MQDDLNPPELDPATPCDCGQPAERICASCWEQFCVDCCREDDFRCKVCKGDL